MISQENNMAPSDLLERNDSMTQPKRSKEAVKLDQDVLDKARVITARRKVSMADYLSDLLRPLVNRDYSKMAKEISSEEEQD